MRGLPVTCRCRSKRGAVEVETDVHVNPDTAVETTGMIPDDINKGTTMTMEEVVVIDNGHSHTNGVWKKVKRGFKVLSCQ